MSQPAASWRPVGLDDGALAQQAFAALSERDFQAKVVQWARLNGWLPVHQLHSRGTEPGWPDLVLLRPPEVIFVELKREKGRVSPAQNAMLARLAACDLEVHLWRPSDWDVIEARLRRRIRPV